MKLRSSPSKLPVLDDHHDDDVGDDAVKTPLKSRLRSSGKSPRKSQKKEGINESKSDDLQRNFEFMGPHGTVLIVLGVPLTVLALFGLCQSNCPPSSSLQLIHAWETLLKLNWFDPWCFGIVTSWIGGHCLFSLLPIGQKALGTPLRDGSRLQYPINGFLSLFPIAGWLIYLHVRFGNSPFVWVADHYHQLGFASAIFAILLSVGLYGLSFRPHALLADGGNTGYPIYDFWMGRELNPRLFNIDLKYICELRPGLIGWALLNGCFLMKQASTGSLTHSMIAINCFQGYYVLDALWNESAILTTMVL